MNLFLAIAPQWRNSEDFVSKDENSIDVMSSVNISPSVLSNKKILRRIIFKTFSSNFNQNVPGLSVFFIKI